MLFEFFFSHIFPNTAKEPGLVKLFIDVIFFPERGVGSAEGVGKRRVYYILAKLGRGVSDKGDHVVVVVEVGRAHNFSEKFDHFFYVSVDAGDGEDHEIVDFGRVVFVHWAFEVDVEAGGVEVEEGVEFLLFVFLGADLGDYCLENF